MLNSYDTWLAYCTSVENNLEGGNLEEADKTVFMIICRLILLVKNIERFIN
jgi:hypothetical protein